MYEVILDRGETPNKCTIAPLAYRADFKLMRVGRAFALGPLQSQVLLHPDGESLTELKADLGAVTGIASIDCIWRRLPTLVERIGGTLPRLARIPDGFVTAYPRRSAFDTDPAGGLATIEAIFIASAVLGQWDPTLLSEYYFGRAFVEMNAARFAELGVSEAKDPGLLPVFRKRPKNSQQRRADRRWSPARRAP